jgi:hypothetical protein
MTEPSALFDYLMKLIPILPWVWKSIQWIINRIRWRGISEDARKIAYAFHSYSWTYLQQHAPVINRVGLIERPEINEIQEVWKSSDTPLLLLGEAGTGKSGIALRLSQELANNGIPVLFIRATDLPKEQDPAEVI